MDYPTPRLYRCVSLSLVLSLSPLFLFFPFSASFLPSFYFFAVPLVGAELNQRCNPLRNALVQLELDSSKIIELIRSNSVTTDLVMHNVELWRLEAIMTMKAHNPVKDKVARNWYEKWKKTRSAN